MKKINMTAGRVTFQCRNRTRTEYVLASLLTAGRHLISIVLI